MVIEMKRQSINRQVPRFLIGWAWMLVASVNLVASGQEQERIFVQHGKARGIHDANNQWRSEKEGLTGQGERVYLYADKMIGKGDFKITARLRMINQKKSAAGFMLGNSFFGFEGAKGEEIFLNGPLCG